MNLLLIVYLPVQEQIKHAIQNALSIFCKLQISRLCVYMRRPPPSIFERNFEVLKFFVHKIFENKYCLLMHKKPCYRRILTFCAGAIKL
jgi:hypothetical protein